MTTEMLPVITFVAIALVAFTTAAFWGVLALSVPIILPLAVQLGTPLPIVIGAMMSAAAFGSHACFYSDSTVLAAQASEVGVMEHALSQLPYVLISAAIAAMGWILIAVI
jgi:Na+/H+ antiporter NhaC